VRNAFKNAFGSLKEQTISVLQRKFAGQRDRSKVCSLCVDIWGFKCRRQCIQTAPFLVIVQGCNNLKTIYSINRIQRKI